jgi:hypothetical protein
MKKNTLSSTGLKSKKRSDNNYHTPLELVKDIFKLMDDKYLESNDTILDPCSGKIDDVTGCRFFNVFKEKYSTDRCEIEEGLDFFNYNKQVDWIIGNPPFGNFTPWLKKTLETSVKGFAYILSPFTFDSNRMELVFKYNFCISKIFPMSIKGWFGFPVNFIIVIKQPSNYVRYLKPVYTSDTNEKHDNVQYKPCL